MTPIIIVSILVLTGGGLFLYSCINKTKNDSQDKNPFLDRATAKNVVKQLAYLDYYKYAAPDDIDSLKEDLTSAIGTGILSTIYFDKPVLPKDYRYYMFDGETVFEQGGFEDALKDMKEFFNKVGLKLEITNHIEDVDIVTNGLNHELTINGKRYVIFKDFKEYGWGEAAQKFAEMINDQFQLQNKDERLYLINGGNDGHAVFLTDKQFQVLDKILTDEEWKPLPVDRWCKVFKVRPIPNA